MARQINTQEVQETWEGIRLFFYDSFQKVFKAITITCYKIYTNMSLSKIKPQPSIAHLTVQETSTKNYN